MLDLFLSEISDSPLLMRDSAVQAVELIRHKLLNGEKIEVQQPPVPKVVGSINPSEDYQGNPFDSYEENTIAVLPIIGNMFKYGRWYSYGVDDIANLLRLANNSSKIIGVILYMNTAGGTSQSVIQLEDALRNRIKPCVAFIDGQCCSGGAYVASFCDQIVAANPMCEIGSVGVQITLRDFSKYYEDLGIKVKTFRPPASKYKNTEFEEAINEDKPERLYDEVLTPFAEHFQAIIKSNRPQLDTSIEGLVEGKVFYAQNAVDYGLIDVIGNYDAALTIVKDLAEKQQSFYSSFK